MCSLRSLVISFWITIQTVNPSFAAYDFWVATNGSDSAAGSQAAPWATIGKARDYIRANPSLTASDITVNISNGTYVLTSALNFTNVNDSGRNGNYIIYRALNGPGTVNLVGSADVNGWALYSGNIWRVYVGTNKTIGTIYENNVRGRLARSPNYVLSSRYPQAQAPYKLSVTGGYDSAVSCDWLQYNAGDYSISNFTSAAQVTWWSCGGYPDWGMASAALVSNNATTRKLYFNSAAAGYPPGDYTSSDRYFVAGIQSFLDVPGEFYYSTADGWLYYYALAGGDPSAQDMRVPVSSSPVLISIIGSAPGTRVHHLKFEGLTLAYTSFGSANQGAFNLQSTDHIEIRNCHICNVGRAAIQMSSDNDHNLVYGCWIEHCGVGGIWVRNYLLRADYPNNKSEFNIISNCKIHDLGEVLDSASLTAGVLLFDTSDCEVSHCDIYNSGRYAISLRGHWSTATVTNDNGYHFAKNNTFKYIRATDCMQDSGDAGIMHAAHCNGSGDPLGSSNINYWKQILISGAYADPSMLDWAPNGIFFDHPNSCLYQNLSNIQIDWVQASNDTNHPSNTGAYRGNSNPIGSQTTSNVNFTGTFNESLMQYSRIGLKPDFPFAYDTQETLIADDNTLDYTESDTSWSETAIGGLSKGDGRYHNSGSGSLFARWLPVFHFTRNYEVSVWKMGNHTNASASAPYTVYYQGGSANVTVNQQTGAGGWVSVGTYPFAAGRDATNGAVKLFANTADGKAIRADAVKFTEAGLLTNGVFGEEKGWWGFENTGADASGFGHTATLSGVGYSTVKAVGTYSAFFNGVSAYASVADHPDLDIGTGDFSIALWFRRDANAAANLRLLSKGAASDTDTGYCLFGSNTNVSFALCNGTSRRYLTGTHLGTNVWNHIVVNVSRSGYMTLYVNGAQAAETSISDWNGTDVSNSRALIIGCNNASSLYWTGRIDELSVFQRLLAEPEIF
jgi:hypothetical protein